jgi:hypothetical protein
MWPARRKPPAASTEPAEDLRRLGEALKARTEDVVSGMVLRTTQSGCVLDDLVENSFARPEQVTRGHSRTNAITSVIGHRAIAAAISSSPAAV